MAGWRQAIELAMSEEEVATLTAVARSRTEPSSRVERARILLAYREEPSCFAVGRAVGVHHQTVQRCVERALAHGAIAALDDRPRRADWREVQAMFIAMNRFQVVKGCEARSRLVDAGW
jgi:Winged helix-turn helix